MKKILLLALAIFGVFILAACGSADTSQQNTVAQNEAASQTKVATVQLDKVRIGWQTQWATQGQLVETWKHTNIMKMNGLEAEYSGVDYGPKLNPLAIAGDLDVFLTADQPAAAALTVGANCKIAGRLMYNNTKVYKAPGSTIESMADITSAAGPTGAAAERVAARGVTAAGGDPLSIKWSTLGMAEQGAAILSGNWPADVIYGFDAAASNFIYQGHAEELYVGHVVSVVVMCNDFMEDHPDAAYRFARAFLQGWQWYATHQEQANAWFKDESRLPFDLAVLDIAASVEPNIQAQSIRDIRPFFNEGDIRVMQEASVFVCQHRDDCTTPLVMADFIDLSFMEKAHAELSESYDPGLVEVTN